jgi:hypothetical protein
MKAVSENAEELRDLMTKLTGRKYDVREAKAGFPPLSHHSSRYVFAPSLEAKSSRYARKLWRDNQSSIYIESFYLGDTTRWIEDEYGEEGATVASAIDHSDFAVARAILAKKFPVVEKSLRDYEKIVSDVSAKRGVNLSIGYEGSNGGAIFYLNAKIEAGPHHVGKDAEQIERNLEALKEAWAKIEEYEREGQQKESR